VQQTDPGTTGMERPINAEARVNFQISAQRLPSPRDSPTKNQQLNQQGKQAGAAPIKADNSGTVQESTTTHGADTCAEQGQAGRERGRKLRPVRAIDVDAETTISPLQGSL